MIIVNETCSAHSLPSSSSSHRNRRRKPVRNNRLLFCYIRTYVQKIVSELRSFNYQSYKNEDLKRRFRLLTKAGDAVLPDEKFRELVAAVSAMESNYARVRVCDYRERTRCDLQLEPEISDALESSRDPEELKYYWQQWYDKAGTSVRGNFETYVRLVNEAARLNSKFDKVCL